MRKQLLAVLTAAALTACSTPGTDPAGAPNADKVTYLTSFSTFGRDAYADLVAVR